MKQFRTYTIKRKLSDGTVDETGLSAQAECGWKVIKMSSATVNNSEVAITFLLEKAT